MSDQVPQQFSDQKIDGSNLINVAGGIKSINGDTTPAQIIAGSLNTAVQDVGAQHNVVLTPFFLNPGGAPVTVTPTVEATILTANIVFAGTYQIVVNLFSQTALPGTTQGRARIYNGPNVIAESAAEASTGASLAVLSFCMTSYLIACAGGEVITAKIQIDAAGTVDFNGVMNAIRIGE